MCGRFTQLFDWEGLKNAIGSLGYQHDQGLKDPRYNVAPTEMIQIIHGSFPGVVMTYPWTLMSMRWGLATHWTNCLINARAESLRTSAFWKKPEWRRCVIPMNGFYEWRPQKTRAGNQYKQPFYVRRWDEGIFFVAGMYRLWQEPDKGYVNRAVLMTVAANAFVAPLHDRMPAIVSTGGMFDWINAAKDPSELLVPYPHDDLIMYPVSPRMNSPQVKDPECIRPLVPFSP